MSDIKPDWENFAKAVLTEWPTGDLHGSVLFDLSLQYGMIQEVPGGYNSDHHIDADCICPEEGDPWYEYTFRGEAGPGLYSISDMNRRIEELEAKLTWKPVETAPKDGRSILLLTRCHGVCEAWFDKGYWTADTPISPREYSGDSWVCCDNAFQIEVEFGPDGYESHGTATHWMPLPVAPAELKGQDDE
jgi:hypothetical protein